MCPDKAMPRSCPSPPDTITGEMLYIVNTRVKTKPFFACTCVAFNKFHTTYVLVQQCSYK